MLFAQVHDRPLTAPLPAQVAAFAGTLPKRNADESEAISSLTETAAFWPTEAADQEVSLYHRAFRQGATLVPRRLVLVETAPAAGCCRPTPCPLWFAGEPATRTRRLEGRGAAARPVDAAYLHPALLGESIAPFRVLAPQRAVIPWDAERGELMDADMAARRGYPRLARWLEKTGTLWEQHKRTSMSLSERIDYHGELSCQFPIAPIRVVYTKAGTNLAAAAVRDRAAVIDHKLYWAATESIEEARYLCGVLNSETLRAGVKRYQSQGQWGPRDFDKYVFNLPIPRFDAGDALHRRLADAAGTAEEVAGMVPGKEGEYFTRTRRRVRAALADDGIAARLESSATELLRG